ncbi:hypothetical protein ColLi_07387 [Colletotrichum liriopes]|uniref:Uncharacterized protein n=1 Tax=Colletotrichum liriopes TaxID=708192 RepID=A0AA37LTR3_9PEZI|nr:hypothetical protein ColLi_07387 [Colletotrichum liriopes]
MPPVRQRSHFFWTSGLEWITLVQMKRTIKSSSFLDEQTYSLRVGLIHSHALRHIKGTAGIKGGQPGDAELSAYTL